MPRKKKSARATNVADVLALTGGITPTDALARRGLAVEPIAKSDLVFATKEEVKRLNESCPTFKVRITGVERDGTPLDVVKTIRAPYRETAIGILTVKATISYGCRVDSCEVVEQQGEEWPSDDDERGEANECRKEAGRA